MNIETQKIRDLVQSNSEYYEDEVEIDLSRRLLEKLTLENEGDLFAELLNNLFSSASSADLRGISTALDSILILLASDREHLFETLMDSEALTLVLEFLNNGYENCECIQNSCAKIILRLAKFERFNMIASQKKIHYIISNNILAQSETLRELTFKLLSELALNSLDIKFEILLNKISINVTKMLQNLTLNPGLLIACIKLISILNQQKSTIEEAYNEQCMLLDILFEFLNSEDFYVMRESLLALNQLFETDAFQEKATNQKFLKNLSDFAEHDNVELKSIALHIIKSISHWGDDYCQFFIENKILYQAQKGLDATSLLQKKVILELLSEYLSRKLSFTQAVFEFEKNVIIKQLINVMKFGEEDLPFMAFQAFTTACDLATFKEIKVLIDKGYLDIIGAVLKKPKDPQIKAFCEKSLEAIVYKTQEEFGKEKHPMIMQCFMKVQTIVKSIYGTAPNNLTKTIGVISMENHKNYRPDSSI